MRVRRLKTVRRHVAFFRHHFGLREPYQVLVDGNFSHVALQTKVHVKDQVPKTLGGKTKELVTRCIIDELARLGPDFSGALFIARRFEHRRCAHDTPVSAAACLASLVADGNPNRYIVATQDATLRAALRQMPGVPILYLQLKTLILEPPSEVSVQAAREIELRKTRPRADEEQALAAAAASTASPARPRRKRPLAPNPNSVRKKKQPPKPPQQRAAGAKRPREDDTVEGELSQDNDSDDNGDSGPADAGGAANAGGAREQARKKKNRRKIKRRRTAADEGAASPRHQNE